MKSEELNAANTLERVESFKATLAEELKTKGEGL